MKDFKSTAGDLGQKSLSVIKRVQYNAPVTLSFALVSMLALLLAHITNGESNGWLFSVYRAPLTDPLTYLRLFGHAFGHAGPAHYINNFVLILLVGPMLEEKYGSKQLAVMMAITTLFNGLLFITISEGRMLGASGIVFMLILLSSFTNLQKGRIPLTLILALIIFVGREAVSGVTVADNISHVSHIMGGICGAVFGFILNKKKLMQTEQYEPPKPEVAEEAKKEV
jgi:membrane associated rhomboid family serine protease